MGSGGACCPTVKLVREDRHHVIGVDRDRTDSDGDGATCRKIRARLLVQPQVIADHERGMGRGDIGNVPRKG